LLSHILLESEPLSMYLPHLLTCVGSSRYGISRFDKVADAKRKCPHVVAVHVATYQEGLSPVPTSITSMVVLNTNRARIIPLTQSLMLSMTRATEPGYWEERDSRTHKVSLSQFCHILHMQNLLI
jgi:hypothetical protein